jgi:uncharacterized protein (DUF3084 family)
MDQRRIDELVAAMDFPASKEEIIEHIRTQGPDEESMLFFESIPDVHYGHPGDIALVAGERGGDSDLE